MENSITNRQISFMIYTIIVGYGVINIPKDAAEIAGTGSWVTILILTIVFMMVTYIITYLQYVYKDKTLFEYGQQLVGKFITYVLIIILAIYFFIYFTMIVRIYSETIVLIMLFKTPEIYLCLLLYIVVFYALIKGINVIARLCEVYGLINILGFILVNSLLISKGRLVNIRPLFVTADLMTYLKGAVNIILPFLGMEALFFIPINKTNNKSIFRYTVMMIAFIGILYIYIVETIISIIGVESVINLKTAFFTVVRGIDINSLEFLRRLDGVCVIYFTMNVICGVSLWGYGTITFTNKIFNKIKYKYIAIIVTIIGFIVSQLPKTKFQAEFILKYNSYVGFLIVIVIPIILFVITKVKKYDKQIL
ncbi:MAG: endospore germination permease [Bacillota bacterium]|nr:endospore germination permease [Bacillota bacterium]